MQSAMMHDNEFLVRGVNQMIFLFKKKISKKNVMYPTEFHSQAMDPTCKKDLLISIALSRIKLD